MRGRSTLALLLAAALGGCDAVERPLANGTRFVAHMSCSCVFNSGRPLEACVADLPREAGWMQLDLDRAAGTVRARALWVEGIAEYHEGRGCALRD